MDQNIVLDKDAHEYNLLTQPDLVFTSVTTFIEQFFEGFDSTPRKQREYNKTYSKMIHKLIKITPTTTPHSYPPTWGSM